MLPQHAIDAPLVCAQSQRPMLLRSRDALLLIDDCADTSCILISAFKRCQFSSGLSLTLAGIYAITISAGKSAYV